MDPLFGFHFEGKRDQLCTVGFAACFRLHEESQTLSTFCRTDRIHIPPLIFRGLKDQMPTRICIVSEGFRLRAIEASNDQTEGLFGRKVFRTQSITVKNHSFPIDLAESLFAAQHWLFSKEGLHKSDKCKNTQRQFHFHLFFFHTIATSGEMSRRFPLKILSCHSFFILT